MDTFYKRQNTTRNVFPRTTNSSVPGYDEVYNSDFNEANSRTIKVKKRKWNAGQSIYDINCYSEVSTKKIIPNELYYQQRPAETTLSLLELDLSTLCPEYSTNKTVHLKVGSNKSSSLNEQRPEKVLSLLGPLFTSGLEYPTKETFRKIIPTNGSPYSNEEALALPELGMSPKINYKTDLNLFSSGSTFSLNSKQHPKTTLSYRNKLNREKYFEIDDPMDIANSIED